MSNPFKVRKHNQMLSSHRKAIGNIILGFPKKFDRFRKHGPLQVILTFIASHYSLASGKGQPWLDALADVASDFGHAFGWIPGASFSMSAFHEARKKLTAKLMVQLWDHLRTETPVDSHTESLIRINGLRFLHIDGSQFNTERSPELIREFGVQTNGRNSECHYPSGQLLSVIEGGTGALLGTHITRCKKKDDLNQSSLTMGERSGLDELLHLQRENDCFVADAGFLSYRFMHNMAETGNLYIIGAGKNWNFVKKCIRAKKADQILTITIPQTHTEKDLRGVTLRVRVITIKGSDGSKKYIVTNVTKDQLSLSEIRKVYKQRWSIEIFFRHIKTYLGMRHLRSRTLAGVRQEIFSVMLFMRMTAYIQSSITCAVNAITNTLDIFTTTFKKTRISLTLKYTLSLCELAINESSAKGTMSTALLLDGLLRNLQTYVPNRKNERVSHSPTGVFKVKRPERSAR